MKYRILSIICLLFFLTSCKKESKKNSISINTEYLLKNLKTLSHDSLEGRLIGSEGNHKAQNFLAEQFENLEIPAAFIDGYIQPFPYAVSEELKQRVFEYDSIHENIEDASTSDSTVIGGNVVGILPGKIDKTFIITAHLDHLGVKDGLIYNGADDDASGAAALLTIADYFKKHPTKHTLIIAALDGEEFGSVGCNFLINNFPIDLKNVSLNINLDMIGRNENNELYACGTYYYPQLKTPLESLETNLTLLLGHDDPNDKDLMDWTNSSDHREFHEKGIPFIYFGEEDHPDYHKPSDTFENIDPEYYEEAVILVIRTIQAYDEYLD